MGSAQWKQASAVLAGAVLVVALISVSSTIRSDSIDKEKSWIAGIREWLSPSRAVPDQSVTAQEKVQAYITDALESRAKGRFSEAVSDLTAGLKLPVDRQTKAELLQVRGGVLMCQHRYDQAVRDFSGEIGLSPEDITGWYNRGLALVHSKQYDAGRVDLVRFGMAIGPSYARAKEATLKDPVWRPYRNSILKGMIKGERDAQTMYHRAMAFVDGQQNRYVAANNEISKAIRLSPNDFWLYRERSKYEFLAGDWRKAWNDYMESVRVAWTAPRQRHHRYSVC